MACEWLLLSYEIESRLIEFPTYSNPAIVAQRRKYFICTNIRIKNENDAIGRLKYLADVDRPETEFIRDSLFLFR